MLSVVIPAFNEEKTVSVAAQKVGEVLKAAGIPHNIIFVDDGSRDATWERICGEAERDPKIGGIRFSRNFGKEAAIFAGLEHASGECIAIIDCDMQHPAEKLVEMYRLWEQGYEVIEGVKEVRGEESAAHSAAAKLFYRFISRAVGTDMRNASDFKLLDRKVVDALNAMPERNVFFRALSFWVGFKRVSVIYSVQERVAGETKWSTGKLIRYALTNISSFTSAPLMIVTVLGIVMLAVSLVLGIIALAQKIVGIALGGFTTVILLQLFSSSLIMICLGIIGYYISKVYEEIKGRPRFIITDSFDSRSGK